MDMKFDEDNYKKDGVWLTTAIIISLTLAACGVIGYLFTVADILL